MWAFEWRKVTIGLCARQRCESRRGLSVRVVSGNFQCCRHHRWKQWPGWTKFPLRKNSATNTRTSKHFCSSHLSSMWCCPDSVNSVDKSAVRGIITTFQLSKVWGRLEQWSKFWIDTTGRWLRQPLLGLFYGLPRVFGSGNKSTHKWQSFLVID